MLQVLKGRYGPYVTDGKNHASLPKGREPATITVEESLEWIAVATARKKTNKKVAKKKATKKVAKKTAKKAAKKTTARKTAQED